MVEEPTEGQEQLDLNVQKCNMNRDEGTWPERRLVSQELDGL